MGRVLRVPAAIAATGLVTWMGYRVIPVNATTISLVYLLTILTIARTWGIVESIVASFLATVCLNFFFLPPLLHFTIADPQNWVALVSFLATAFLVSKLSTQARLQTRSALDREREMERLYALSRGILLVDINESVASQAARQIAHAFGFAGVSLFERSTGEIYRAGVEDLVEWDDRLREVAVLGTVLQEPATQTVVTAVRLGAEPIGSLALRGDPLPDSVLQSAANLVAIALERARTVEAANLADVSRRSEQLKSTLLDAIAHEFKTPLTSIKAAASALLETSFHASVSQRELASIVEEEADRLGRLVSEAIQMARIEAGRVHLNRRPEPVGELVRRVLAAHRVESSGHPLRVDLAADLPPVDVDAELIELALRLILDNALKYSPEGSPITIRAHASADRLVIGMHNEGRGIPEGEQAKIFQKFYRATDVSGRVPGTGMGLAISRDIVQAHQGQIWVESAPGQGAEFLVSLPLSPQEALA